MKETNKNHQLVAWQYNCAAQNGWALIQETRDTQLLGDDPLSSIQHQILVGSLKMQHQIN